MSTSARRNATKRMVARAKPRVEAQANANSALQNLLDVQRAALWRSRRHPLRVPTEVRTCLIEHFSQHVMLLVHPNELFPNDLAETLGTRRQTAKAVVNGAIEVMPSATAALTVRIKCAASQAWTKLGATPFFALRLSISGSFACREQNAEGHAQTMQVQPDLFGFLFVVAVGPRKTYWRRPSQL